MAKIQKITTAEISAIITETYADEATVARSTLIDTDTVKKKLEAFNEQ